MASVSLPSLAQLEARAISATVQVAHVTRTNDVVISETRGIRLGRPCSGVKTTAIVSPSVPDAWAPDGRQIECRTFRPAIIINHPSYSCFSTWALIDHLQKQSGPIACATRSISPLLLFDVFAHGTKPWFRPIQLLMPQRMPWATIL